MSNKKLFISKKYSELASKLRRYPTLVDMKEIGITREAIRQSHNSITKLREYSKNENKKYFARIYDLSDVINDVQGARDKRLLKKFKKFYVSSVGSGPVFKQNYDSIMNYCKINKSLPIFLPISHKIENIDPFLIEKYKRGEIILAYDNIVLNENLKIVALDQKDTTMNPTSGLKMTGHKSMIVPGAVQMYDSIPIKKGGNPRAIMSTGCVTKPVYLNKNNPRSKTILKATGRHIIGGWIVEIEDKKTFYVRQTQANKDGSFPDWGVEYHPKKTKKIIPEMAMGDLHSLDKDEKAFQSYLKLAKELKCKSVYMHDISDCLSINPHDLHKAAFQINLHIQERKSLSKELTVLADDLNRLTSVFDEVNIVDSNHNDFLLRALDKGDILKDPENGLLASILYPFAILSYMKGRTKNITKQIEDRYGIKGSELIKQMPGIGKLKSVLEVAVNFFGVKDQHKVKWHGIDDSKTVGGFEMLDHGHKGSNGARGGLNTSAVVYPKSIVGHGHSPKQINYNIVLGHLVQTDPCPEYIKGGYSSWAVMCGLVYPTGQFQFVPYLNGKHRASTRKTKKKAA
jgi:hypothetical protein